MAHVTPELLAPFEAVYGRPRVLHWRYPISPPEMRMVVSSTRGQTRLHDVTLFIFNRKGEIALIRKPGYPDGAWRAPGGGVDPGETFEEGAVREALEETGLHVRLTRYLLRFHVDFTCEGQVQPWTTHVLTAETADEAVATNDPGEIDGGKFGTVAELCGPIAAVLRGTGRGLFAYRSDLHDEVARLL
jgi:8-oxo-dGTP pyrophosphatase MutT (NUDIX family)